MNHYLSKHKFVFISYMFSYAWNHKCYYYYYLLLFFKICIKDIKLKKEQDNLQIFNLRKIFKYI